MQFTNFETSELPYIGSATISRRTICAFLGINKPLKKLRISDREFRIRVDASMRPEFEFRNSKLNLEPINVWVFTRFPQPEFAPGYRAFLSFRPLRAVLGAALLTIRHSSGIERSTNNVISNARQILYTTAADQDDGVFLQIVADTGDVRCYFDPIGQTHTCNFAKGRIRLLWC